MKKVYLKLLQDIYKNQTLNLREVVNRVERIHGDHRDFYPLIGLFESGYIGTTIPIIDGKYSASMMTWQLQAISQGRGRQMYRRVEVEDMDEDNYFYISGKGIEFFANRDADTKRIRTSFYLSLFAALFVAFMAEPIKTLWVGDHKPSLIKVERQDK